MNTTGNPLSPGTLLLASSPCPFCGSTPRDTIEQNEIGIAGWQIACVDSGCPAQPKVWSVSRPDALAMWCRRAQ